ncbi:MAG: malto-oligosyltrehalose synthase [Pseudomonadota bacterium]
MTPRATYRLQFRGGTDFHRAIGLIPYLKRLGISHLYASPIFAAASGSAHGYDVVDCNVIDPVLGGKEGLLALSHHLKHAGIGLILDIVPNHMAASLENPWWRDVIEWGYESAYANHFDVDWRQKLTLPLLPASYESVLGSGDLSLRLDRRNACLALACPAGLLPLHPASYPAAVAPIAHPLARSFAGLAAHAAAGDQAWRREAESLLASASLGDFEEELGLLARNRDHIAGICRLQPWRLMAWRDARHSLSYRRFFEIAGLVGLRVESEQVFADVHRTVLSLLDQGIVDGLRVDHVDGLADPGAYLKRLRAAVGPETYVVIEKILAEDEDLPPDWPVQGTTGYEFIAALSQVFVAARGRDRLMQSYLGETDHEGDLESERRQAKLLIVRENFAGELRRLAALSCDAAGMYAEADFASLISGLIAGFPVYRTYGDDAGLNQRDGRVLESAVENLRASEMAINDAALEWLVGALARGRDEGACELRRRFQQLSSAVMAKAVEDTLFYRWHAFIALNEVGCDPGQKLEGGRRFHDLMAARAAVWPNGLTASATHDTKRGEDARARLYALSEHPEEWLAAMARWRELNRPIGAPASRVEWLFYQTLAGVWPAAASVEDGSGQTSLARRLLDFLEKAMREEKLHTSWTDINPAYEDAVRRFARRVLQPGNVAFLTDFATTMERFVTAGWINSLAQTLIKLTAPGVPDIYQGSEAGDFSLVDPDNRRPVDFGRLGARLAASLNEADRTTLVDGGMKQYLISACLEMRRARPALFAAGTYEPLPVSGPRSAQVIAYLRRRKAEAAITIVPILTSGDGWLNSSRDYWNDTHVELPGDAPSSVQSLLSGEIFDCPGKLEVGRVLRAWPVALLTGRL